MGALLGDLGPAMQRLRQMPQDNNPQDLLQSVLERVRSQNIAPSAMHRQRTGGLFGNPVPQEKGLLSMLASGGAPSPAQSPQPLGGRAMPVGSPFDYEGARNAMLPPVPKRSTWQAVAEIAAPALLALGGNQQGANDFIANMALRRREADQRRFEAEHSLANWEHGDWSAQNRADLDASQPFTIGNDRLSLDPATGQVATLYDGPSDWESYAQSLNLTEGTPEYNAAMQDYVLRSAGPTATANFGSLDDRRTANDVQLEGVRFGHRSSLEAQRQGGARELESQRQGGRVQLRGMPTYRDTHGPAPRQTKAPTATAPDGRQVQLINGKWVPIK